MRLGICVAFLLSLGASASGQTATSTPDLSNLMFGHDALDLLARLGFIVVYGSSVLSRGVHRAYPVIDPEKHRLVAFISGCLDGLSVNGQGYRQGDEHRT